MSQVVIDGVFMGAQLKTSTFDGNTKTTVLIDVYQPESEQANKTLQLRTEDIQIYQKLLNDFAMGSLFKAKAIVTAYKNQAYFKFVSVME